MQSTIPLCKEFLKLSKANPLLFIVQYFKHVTLYNDYFRI